jgi:hypothetical protein
MSGETLANQTLQRMPGERSGWQRRRHGAGIAEFRR